MKSLIGLVIVACYITTTMIVVQFCSSIVCLVIAILLFTRSSTRLYTRIKKQIDLYISDYRLSHKKVKYDNRRRASYTPSITWYVDGKRSPPQFDSYFKSAVTMGQLWTALEGQDTTLRPTTWKETKRYVDAHRASDDWEETKYNRKVFIIVIKIKGPGNKIRIGFPSMETIISFDRIG